MAFVQFAKVSLAFGDRDILKDVSLNLASGTRAALAGANGSGKSTLMRVIAGKLKADSGERAAQKDTRIAYLPQSGLVHQGRTLYAEAESAFTDAAEALSRMDELGRDLEKAADDDERTRSRLEEYQRLHERVEASGWYERKVRIDMTLSGLGFSQEDLHRDVAEFSGGWQMRIALAKILLETPDILLLDEPTNYLDIEARSWLERWLRDFHGAYLVVSHDRYFLDVTVDEVYELFQGELKRYAGNYTNYERTRQLELASLIARYEAQREEIAKTEDFIRRFRYNASKAAMVQERIKRLEKMSLIEIPESLKRIHFTFPPPPHSGRIALRLNGLGKSYGARRVLAGLDLVVESGEKLCVVGRNGAGKTTLLRILAGRDENYEGEREYGSGISLGYFSQEAAEAMSGSLSIIETLEAGAPTSLIPKLRDLAGAFLFRGDDIHKAVSVLSGGEKSRLALLNLLLRPVNLLLLDEPTNHLDLHSKDVLLDALKRYPGTVLFVSHDRSFMEALSEKTLELSAAGPRLFFGGYAYYQDRVAAEDQERKGLMAGSDQAASDKAKRRNAQDNEQGSEETGPGLSAAEYRDAEKRRQGALRRFEREEVELLEKLDTLEGEKAELAEKLQQPETYSDAGRCVKTQKRLESVQARIDEATKRWEFVAAECERLRTASA